MLSGFVTLFSLTGILDSSSTIIFNMFLVRLPSC